MRSRNQITEALVAARRLLSKSQSDLNRLSERELVTLHENLEEITDRLGGLIPGATPPGRIEDFFTQVGEGMLASQAELDRQSFAYNVARPPGALPSAYRIPKVQAEIGFTMSRKRQRGFSIFALGTQSSNEKAHSNTVTFEIIATPPVQQGLDELPLGARLITASTDRDQVRELLRSAKLEGANARGAMSVLNLQFDSVLILAQRDKWLLCLPQKGERPSLLYGVLEHKPLKFVSFGPVPPSQAKHGRALQLFDFLDAIAAEQALALATLNGASLQALD